MFPEFIYEGYHYDVQSDGLHISFSFRLKAREGVQEGNERYLFQPSAIIPSRPFLRPELLSSETLDSLVFHIGMIELVSYWKCFCPPTVVVKPFRLSDRQIDFWKKLRLRSLDLRIAFRWWRLLRFCNLRLSRYLL